MTPREPLLTATEIAEELKVDPETVRRWVREGYLRAVKFPGTHKAHMRFRRQDVEDFLAAHERGEPEAVAS